MIRRPARCGSLRELGFRRVTLCGLVAHFSVLYSALDSRGAGFETGVVRDAGVTLL